MAHNPSSPDPELLTLATSLRRTVSHLHRRLRPAMKLEGIALAKLSVLGHLVRHDCLTPTELAALDGVKVQTLTRLLAELEAEGLLLRKPHPGDARQTQLTLSKQGLHLLAQGGRTADAHAAKVMSTAFNAQERALLRAACELLARLADAV
jgi:DNA-binding MarR family transcriptional regulator